MKEPAAGTLQAALSKAASVTGAEELYILFPKASSIRTVGKVEKLIPALVGTTLGC